MSIKLLDYVKKINCKKLNIEKMDIVYTFVDSTDKNWLKKIKNFIETEFKKINTNPEINTDNIIIVSTTDKFTSSINSSFNDLNSEEDQQQDEFLTQDNISENESIFSEDLSL